MLNIAYSLSVEAGDLVPCIYFLITEAVYAVTNST